MVRTTNQFFAPFFLGDFWISSSTQENASNLLGNSVLGFGDGRKRCTKLVAPPVSKTLSLFINKTGVYVKYGSIYIYIYISW